MPQDIETVTAGFRLINLRQIGVSVDFRGLGAAPVSCGRLPQDSETVLTGWRAVAFDDERDERIVGAVLPLKGPPEVRGDGAADFVDELVRLWPVHDAPGLPGGRCEQSGQGDDLWVSGGVHCGVGRSDSPLPAVEAVQQPVEVVVVLKATVPFEADPC